MGLFTGLFSKSAPEDFEQVLAALQDDINKRETRLSEIRLRERRITLLVTLYTVGFWVVYVSVWYTNPGLLPLLAAKESTHPLEKFVKGVPVATGPIIILFCRRIVQLFYERKETAEEATLRELRKQQRSKIEDFKKKSKYYETRDLLERYDDGPTPDSPPRKRAVTMLGPGAGPVPAAGSQGSPNLGRASPSRNQLQVPRIQTPTRPGPQLPPHLTGTRSPMPPPRKQWFDKVADALLGEDDVTGGPASRYALICQKCFAHNGLVKESMWEDVQYQCPKCGHFNPSARSMRDGTAPVSPASALLSSASPTGPQASSTGMPFPTGPAPGTRAASEEIQRRKPRTSVGTDSAEVDIDS
jgi:hypothetical protein